MTDRQNAPVLEDPIEVPYNNPVTVFTDAVLDVFPSVDGLKKVLDLSELTTEVGYIKVDYLLPTGDKLVTLYASMDTMANHREKANTMLKQQLDAQVDLFLRATSPFNES